LDTTEHRQRGVAAREQPSVRKGKPQNRRTLLCRHFLQQYVRFGIVESEQRELLAAIERCDGTRRETTEASARVVQQDGASDTSHVWEGTFPA
jgi:hypothetical protein